MTLAAPVLLWAITGVASAAPVLTSDIIDPRATHCGWKLGAATARQGVLAHVDANGRKSCQFDMSDPVLQPTPPFNTRTTRIDVTAYIDGEPLSESKPSEHRYIKVTTSANYMRYDVIQSLSCTKLAPVICFPF
jgi:hypothetical protein